MKTTIGKSPSPNRRHSAHKRSHGLLTLDTILRDAQRLCNGKIRPRPCICLFGQLLWKRKIRINPLLSDIVRFIAIHNYVTYPELYNRYSYVNRRSLRRYLNELQRLRWIRRFAKDYHLNPFFLKLIELDFKYILLKEYAAFKFDFFEIFNMPLRSALFHRVKTVKIESHEVKKGYFNPIFKGIVVITLELKNGQKTVILLPYNLHGQHAYGETCLLHYCLPLSWSLFNIETASYYGSIRKRKHHKGAINKQVEFIHFDNSISIMFQPKDLPNGLFYLPCEKEMHKMEKDSLKWWNGKGKEYTEFSNFGTLERLFDFRFVKGKKGLNLFNALGLKRKNLHRAY